VTVELTPARERTTWRSLPPLALVPLAAAVWWVVGFLPWILDGLGPRLPAGESAPTMTIPLLAGHVGELVLGAGLGGAAAGLSSRLGTGSQGLRAGACAVGVAGALFVTVLQSRHVVGGSIFLSTDVRVTNGLSVLVMLTALVGLGLGLLAMTGPVGLGLGIATVAGAVPAWLAGVLLAVGVADSGSAVWVNDVGRWAAAASLVVALVTIGVRPAVRLVAWPGAVLLAWLVGPTLTAASYMEVYLRPGMGMADMWGDGLSAAADVWRMAASLDARPLAPWITAIVVAAALSLWLARQPTAASKQPAQ